MIMSGKPVVKFSMDGAARRKAEQEEKILLDYQNDMYASEQKGIELGKQEGIELGKQEGKTETAKCLLGMGLTVDQIVQATGLSEDQIKSLE
jgi:predicted transposase/invertase (TIGR01784 family)